MRHLIWASFAMFCVTFALFSRQSVRASGLLVPGQGASGLGTAYAGGAAQAEDASTLFFNPAGIALLDNGQFQAGLTAVFPSAQFQNEGSRYSLPNTSLNGMKLEGANGGEAGTDAVVPTLAITQRVLSGYPYGDLSLGAGVSVPSGLATDYSPGWVGRYSALRSKLSTFDIQPTMAYRLWDRLSVGVSLDVQYASARLTQAIDFGLAGADAIGQFTQSLPTLLTAQGVPAAAIPGIIASTQKAYNAAGFVPGGRDAISEVTGNDWALGFSLGAMLEYLKSGDNNLFQDGRVGFGYRSAVSHDLRGNAQFRNVPALTAPGAPVQFPSPNLFQSEFFDQGASAQLSIPEIYHFSIYQRLLREFALMGDIEWTRWSILQSINVKFNSTSTPNSLTQLGYDDSLRFATGVEWIATRNLELRCGFAYDETPIKNATFRIPRLPDNDQYTLSVGFRWTLNRLVDVDVGYAHVFLPESGVNVTDNQGHNLRGRFSTSGNLAGVSITLLWGGSPEKESLLLPRNAMMDATWRIPQQ